MNIYKKNRELDYKDKNIVMRRYDLTYSSYDELYSHEQFDKYRSSLLEIFNNFKDSNIVNLLDIGCGTGLLLKFINEETTGKNGSFYYVGIDLSLNSIKLAREKKEEHNIVDFIVGDAENPLIRLDAIDIAVSYTVIHHFKDPLKFLYGLINGVKKKVVISTMKNDASAKLLNKFDLTKRYLDKNFKYIKIIGEKDIIIVFELDQS